MKKWNFRIVWLGALAVAAQAATFDSANDIFVPQFDSNRDPDAFHSIAALGCMLAHRDYADVNTFAVHGAYGTQNDDRFIASPDLFTTVFGAEDTGWVNASPQEPDWNGAVAKMAAKVKPVLLAGGTVWVAEGGQSDFTADWVRALIDDGVSASVVNSHVIVVQHSLWNERYTTDADLAYVQSTCTYQAINQGDGTWTERDTEAPATPSYRSPDTAYLTAALTSQNATASNYWAEAQRVIDEEGYFPGHSYISVDGVDFSDVVEAHWIFGSPTDCDTVDTFWSAFVVNNTNAPWVRAGTNQTIGLPDNQVSFAGTVEDNGTITNLVWTQESGPSIATLSGTNSLTLTASDLVAGTYVFRLSATDDEGNTDSDTVSVLVNENTVPTITTTTLPDATATVPYSQQLQHQQGEAPFMWSLKSGSLPDGMTLSANGVISGTPVDGMTRTFTVSVKDRHDDADDQELTLIVDPTFNTSIIDFTHQEGTHTIRAADVDSPNGDIWNFSDSMPLFDGVETGNDSNTRIYGGLQATWNNTNYAPNFQLRASDELLYLQVNAGTSSQGLEGILVWNKADFLNYSGETVVFDAASSMRLTIPAENGVTRARFVVNNAGVYYVSANEIAAAGTLSLNDPAVETWAPIETNDYSIGTFAVQGFSDIRGVGIYLKQSSQNQTIFRLDDFQVSATMTSNPPPEKSFGIVDFTQVNGQVTVRAADIFSDTGYTWNFSDSSPLWDAPETGGDSNTRIYGGIRTFWAATNYSPIIQLRALKEGPPIEPGYLHTQVNPLSDGDKGQEALFVWNKADFLTHSTSAVVFNATSSMSLNIMQKGGTMRSRFVVNNGGTYYVSNTSTNNTGTLTLSNPGAEPWAPVSTTDYSIGTYAARNFTDIQGVGIYVMQSKGGTAQSLYKFDDFQVSAGTAERSIAEEWLAAYGLSGSEADWGADLENGGLGDGMNNLLEYALGGNPTENDAEALQPLFQPLGNHVYYVHNERTDDPALTYTVQISTNLVSKDWKTNGVEFVGEAAFSNGWETVTNRTDIGDGEFIRLQVEKTE